MNTVLTPFFDIVNYIVTETDIRLRVDIFSHDTGNSTIHWYVGSCDNPRAGNYSESISTDDIDKTKLNRWVAELNALAYPCIDCGGHNLKPDADCGNEQWCLDCDDWAHIGKGRIEQSRQDDRTLADGKIKTSTGYVEEPTCTDRQDFAPDLGSNKP